MKKKRNYSTVILIIILIAGLSLLLYPTVSDYWNSFRSTQAIMSYSEEVAALNAHKYDEMWDEARKYNATLLDRTNDYLLSDEQKEKYDSLFDITGTGVMGYVEIPSIGCSLPLYHGTDDSVLQIAVGHLEWTSLPTGGISTHSVFSGHRGLPSAKLFSDLDKVSEGDIFMLRILNEVLTYEVDRISIVEPHETEALHISEGEDLCTLFTCTPYGVNSHRILVRGQRTDNTSGSDSIKVTANATMIRPLIVAPVLAIPALLALLVFLLTPKKPPSAR